MRHWYEGQATRDGAMMREAGEDLGQERTSMRKGAFASFVGTAIEFYDFYIYGTAAALVFGGFSFPRFSPERAPLAALAPSGARLLAGPWAGRVLGHFGAGMGEREGVVAGKW